MQFLPYLAFLVVLVPARAYALPPQLDVPDDGARRAGSEEGVEVPRNPRGDLAPGSSKAALQRRKLDVGPGALPTAPSSPDRGDPDADLVRSVLPGPAEQAVGANPPSAASAAGESLAALRAIDKPNDPRLSEAVARLLEQGPAGVAAARLALYGDGVGLVLGGAQVLLAAGAPADRDQVVARLQRKLPTRAAAPLLTLLGERDPVRASPEVLIGLYEHPQGAVRDAAARLLATQLAPSHVPLLAAALRSGSSNTRMTALESLAGIDDPAARNLVLDRLSDPTAKVAARAAQLLANDGGAEAELLALAFPAEAVRSAKGVQDRKRDYARLALVEREDRRGVALVGEERVPELLADLASSDALKRGAAALLLSGIGFRARGSRGYEWLDRAVPHELVRALSGDVFHRDFSSLADPVQRRMALLSGRTFGANGAAWQTWWVDAYADFRAHRAVIDVTDDDRLALSVRYKEGPPTMRVLRFLGPEAPPDDPATPVVGRTIRLSAAQAVDLARRLAEEGVFGPERSPSPSVAFTAASRELEVRVREQSKRFVLPSATAEGADPWLDRLTRTFVALEEDARWQAFPAGRTPDEFWLAEAPWWDVPRDPAERDARLKTLVLSDLRASSTFERGGGIAELERLSERDVLGPEDHSALLGLLEDERYYGERVPRLVRLACDAVRDADGAIPADLAVEVVEILAERYAAEAAADVVDVLSATDPAVTRETARSELPLLRALAAAGLARRAEPEDVELLRAMLSDPSQDVEAAAVLAHAEAGLDDAGDELLFRARIAEPRVRAAALRAVGLLRIDGARDALVQGLADSSQAVQIASVEGLAELRDPSSATLFTSILARGSRSHLFDGAMHGLRALGADAHPALLRSAQAVGGGAARDAALLLSEDLVPDAAPILIRLLQADAGDARVAGELAILTCYDARGESDPAGAWAQWWATVVRDDPLAWFRAACEREGLTPPPAEAFTGEGTVAARLFLVSRMAVDQNHVVERARRELARMLGRELGTLPTRGALRSSYLDDLSARILAEER